MPHTRAIAALLARAVREKESWHEAEERHRAKMVSALQALYEAGVSDAVVSEQLGVSRQRVYQLRTGRAH